MEIYNIYSICMKKVCEFINLQYQAIKVQFVGKWF